MLLTCVLTVDSVTTSRSAISALVRPSASSASTSRSRSVRAAPGAGGSVMARMSTSVTSGARVAMPACVCRMAAASSREETFLST